MQRPTYHRVDQVDPRTGERFVMTSDVGRVALEPLVPDALGEPTPWRVGAIAEKDPSQPWEPDEVKRRIWTLEQRADTERTLSVLLLIAVGAAGVGMIAVAAAMWGGR